MIVAVTSIYISKHIAIPSMKQLIKKKQNRLTQQKINLDHENHKMEDIRVIYAIRIRVIVDCIM